MNWMPLPQILMLTAVLRNVVALEPPTGLVSRTGDQSIVLHWDRSPEANVSGYRVFRSRSSAGPFAPLSSSLAVSPGYCDLAVTNGANYFYRVTAVLATSEESLPSATVAAMPRPFESDDAFLEYIQQVHFDYFWYLANPRNGLVPDRTAPGAACSIAAVGFGLTAIGIGIDHGWIARTQGVARVLTTLNTFLNQPQGPAAAGTIGYKGWFYHFLHMDSAVRAGAELSSIDTALLLAGVLHARQYFDGPSSDETAIRAMADALFNRVDWNWMARGTNLLSMGWLPESGFLANNWVGYNEAMLLYLLGLGAASNPLPDSAWGAWTSGYTWAEFYGRSYVPFGPLFGHQYSHCWVDFRQRADAYMNARMSTYFENSRRATLAQRDYCIANPNRQVGYSSNVWGLTACDGPWGYRAHGAPGPETYDDGTIAPTAAAASIPFTPEHSLPTLRYFYSHFRPRIWTAYGFRAAFNLGAQWWGPDELGIDQGPIVLMIENYRTQRPWRVFMGNPEVQRGLKRAGFVPLPFVGAALTVRPDQDAVQVVWNASAGGAYRVEFSPDLDAWFMSPTGRVTATGTMAAWTDTGPPPRMLHLGASRNASTGCSRSGCRERTPAVAELIELTFSYRRERLKSAIVRAHAMDDSRDGAVVPGRPRCSDRVHCSASGRGTAA